jgi:hypothetical protein
VLRHTRGESGRALSEEFGLPSPSTVAHWASIFRRDGEDGLRPKRRGRPPNRSWGLPSRERDRGTASGERSAEVAYLGKLRALEVTGTTLKVRAVDDLKAHYPLPLVLRVAAFPGPRFMTTGADSAEATTGPANRESRLRANA